MLNPYTIPGSGRLIVPIARKYRVRRVSIFGSVSEGKANLASDVDLCIDAEEALDTSVDVITTSRDDKEFLEMIRLEEAIPYEQ